MLSFFFSTVMRTRHHANVHVTQVTLALEKLAVFYSDVSWNPRQPSSGCPGRALATYVQRYLGRGAVDPDTILILPGVAVL